MLQELQNASTNVYTSSGELAPAFVKVARRWEGPICRAVVRNDGPERVKIKEIVLFEGAYAFSSDTGLYGEGYNMLSQYEGTLTELRLVGQYSDRDHYKMPQKQGFRTVYNLALVTQPGRQRILLAFTSCNRFNGEFRFGDNRYEIAMDCENLTLFPGEEWVLEEFGVWMGEYRERLFDELGERIQTNHPRLPTNEVPTGWCSWYCYGPDVTERDVVANLDAISHKVPELRYIQIDDGYQAFMGDWLSFKPGFTNVEQLCRKIREKGFQPAIWVAPFIAEAGSALFREHSEWFVKDEKGAPLSSADVSFGGWRNGPWYMLDGTHPEARDYLRNVFQIMREQWGCRYFKLDANMWGALHGGFRHDPSATRVEAYRKGMEAVLQGAGDDSFVLGCNAPMWPTLGMVHGMRITDDLSRDWRTIELLANQGFRRNWQHGRLWVNDPDCLVLDDNAVTLVGPDGVERVVNHTSLTTAEFGFHWAYIFASGGMVLSGDKVTQMSEKSIAKLRKCLPPTGRAARFDDANFHIGRAIEQDEFYICLFNPAENSQAFEVGFPYPADVTDLWSDHQSLGMVRDSIIIELPPHCARVFQGKRVEG